MGKIHFWHFARRFHHFCIWQPCLFLAAMLVLAAILDFIFCVLNQALMSLTRWNLSLSLIDSACGGCIGNGGHIGKNGGHVGFEKNFVMTPGRGGDSATEHPPSPQGQWTHSLHFPCVVRALPVRCPCVVRALPMRCPRDVGLEEELVLLVCEWDPIIPTIPRWECTRGLPHRIGPSDSLVP